MLFAGRARVSRSYGKVMKTEEIQGQKKIRQKEERKKSRNQGAPLQTLPHAINRLSLSAEETFLSLGFADSAHSEYYVSKIDAGDWPLLFLS